MQEWRPCETADGAEWQFALEREAIICPLTDEGKLSVRLFVAGRSTRSIPSCVGPSRAEQRNKLRWRTDPLSVGGPGFKCSSYQEIRDLAAVKSVGKQKSKI